MSVTLGNLGTNSVVGTASSTTLATKGIAGGSGITISTSSTDVTVAQTSPYQTIADICIVTNSTNQSIGSIATVTLAFDSEELDPSGMHDNVTNNSRINILSNGIYQVSANTSWNIATSSGVLLMYIVRVSPGPVSTTIASVSSYFTAGTNPDGMSVTRTISLTSGDYLRINVFNGTANTQTVNSTATYTPIFSACKISN